MKDLRQIRDIVFELRNKEEDKKEELCHSNTLTKKYGINISTCGVSP